MTQILMLRHGESVANHEDRFAGHSDFDLTDTGRKQAELAAAYIKSNYRVDAIYSSDLLRAFHTAQPSARLLGLDIIPDKELREIFAGRWESMTFTDIINDYPDEFAVWRDDFGMAECPGGESVAQMSARICAAVSRIAAANDGKTVLIATHATPVRAIECLARGYTSAQMSKVNFVKNAALSVFGYDGGIFTPVRGNITEYLQGLKTGIPETFQAK